MKKFLVIAATAASVIAFAANANAWERHGSATGPGGGTVSSHASGHCTDDTCTRRGRITGPAGNSVTYGSSTTCQDGVCTRRGKITGPLGRTFTYRRSFSRY